MFRKVNISSNQKVTESDFADFGNHPRETFDAVVRDFGGFPALRYTGLQVEQSGVSTVRTGQGRIWKADGAGYVFDSAGGETTDLLDHLPAVARRIATIVAWGNTVDTDLQPRTFLIDPETRATEGREVATESRRQAYVGFLLGVENPTPTAPAVPADYVAVAHVMLTPAGVESITQLTANRVVSIRANQEAIAAIDARLTAVGPELETAKSSIVALADATRGKADRRTVTNLALDVALLKNRSDLPDDYSAWGADTFTDDSQSDTAAAGYAARVHLGLRFPDAARATRQLALENAIDARVTVRDNFVLPKFRDVLRFSLTGRDGEYALADATVETRNAVTRYRSRTVVETVAAGTYPANARYILDGQMVSGVQTGSTDPLALKFYTRDGEIFDVKISYPSEPTTFNMPLYTLYKTVSRTITEPYLEEVADSQTITGSMVGQTFLQGSDGYLTGLDLYFTRAAGAGEVRVLVTDTLNGLPDLSRVLAQVTLAPGALRADLAGVTPTPAALPPTPLVKGRHYSVVLVSTGAHFVATVSANKLASGALFVNTSTGWQQGNLATDLPMRQYFAEFEAPIVRVPLEPLELAGGIDAIRINADSMIHDGTTLDYEYLIAGQWRSPNTDIEETLLATRPSLVQVRAVMIGTKDAMPSFGIGNRSEVVLSRPATGRTHIGKPVTLPAPAGNVIVRVRYENWDAAKDGSTAVLLTGAGYATVETADATADVAQPDGAMEREYSFVLPAPVSTFRIRETGTAVSNAHTHHISAIRWVAFD